MKFLSAQDITFFIRILLACLCGAVIGIERQQRTKVAGIRTHLMISLAASVMMIISKYGFMDVLNVPGASYDVSRVAAGIITGVGIVGGGIIYIGKQGAVSGITTAAGVWATIGIGMSLGAGMYTLGIGTTIIMIILQFLLHKNLLITKQPTRAAVTFKLSQDEEEYKQLLTVLENHKIVMMQSKWERKSNNILLLKCQLIIPIRYERDEIISIFFSLPQMDSFELI